MSNNDALREALMKLKAAQIAHPRAVTVLVEEAHDLLEIALAASKPEQQAQMEAQRQNFWQVLELRERMIAKKDAALKACVEQMQSALKWCPENGQAEKILDATIQQAEEALSLPPRLIT